MPAEWDWPACSPPGSGFPKPVHPGPGVQGSPQPQSPSLTKALGGVEPRSHCLPVSLARLKTAVTRTEKAAPARGLQGSGHGTAKPGPPGPLPLAPGDASLHARRVRAQTSTVHLPEVLGRGPVSPTDRSPTGSLLLLTSARSGLRKGRDANFQPVR